MMIVRPCRENDLDHIFTLIHQAGFGMTNLPAQKDRLAEKIHRSIQSFAKTVTHPHDEIYFFVLEDLSTHTIVGTCGIIAQNDYEHPFYHYKITHETRISHDLNLVQHHRVLHLVNDYEKLSEVGMLFLHPEYRKKHYGQLLSRSRFLFIAEQKQRFTSKIITEFRGVINEKGHSPFWQSLGHKFIDLPFTQVDKLMARGEKKFIAELIPRAPIYMVLLSQHAQEAIGSCHHDTAPAVKLLQNEGFINEEYVGIFDAGLSLSLNVAHGYTINHSKPMAIADIKEISNPKLYLVSTTGSVFYASIGAALIEENTITLSPVLAENLNVARGDILRCIPLETEI